MNKGFIIKILICIVMIISIITILILYNNRNIQKEDEIATDIQEYMDNTNGKIQKVESSSILAQVQSCIQKYYLYYFAIYGDNTVTEVLDNSYDKEDYKKLTIKFLSNEYINKSGLSVENIDSYNEEIREPDIEIYNIYYVTKYNGVSAFFVNGKVRDSITYNSKKFDIIVVLDGNNNTFELYLDGYLPDLNFEDIKEGDIINFEIPEKVEDREINRYGAVNNIYDDFARDKFENIRVLLLNDYEKAYELLTDSLKENKFSSFEKFTEYLDNNKRSIFLLTYSGYEVKNNDGNIILKTYDKNNKICITIYFDAFSSFKFDIEEL